MVDRFSITKFGSQPGLETHEIAQPVRHAAVKKGGKLRVRDLKRLVPTQGRVDARELDRTGRGLQINELNVVRAGLDGVLRDSLVPRDGNPVSGPGNRHVKEPALISVGAFISVCCKQVTRNEPVLNLPDSRGGKSVGCNRWHEDDWPFQAFCFVDSGQVNRVQRKVDLAVE